MSGTDENHTIYGVVVPEHPKHERPQQTAAFKPQWRIVLLILARLNNLYVRLTS